MLGLILSVRESIFVRLNEPGAIISYEVEGKSDIDLRIQFQPVLNLMWPGALGGQDTGWDNAARPYVIREPLHGWSAVIASPQTIEHDVIVNRTVQPTTIRTLMLRPSADRSPKSSCKSIRRL